MTRQRPFDLAIAHARLEGVVSALRDAATDLAIRARDDAEPFEAVSAALEAAVAAQDKLAQRFAGELDALDKPSGS